MSFFLFAVLSAASLAPSPDFPGLDFALGDGFGEAFANSGFLGAGFGNDFGLGFGVVFGFGVGVEVGFGVAVAVGLGFGGAVGNSISLFASVTAGLSSSASSVFGASGSGGEIKLSAGGEAPGCGSSAARSCAPLSQTMLCGFDEFLAATLQRINPRITATCASAISATFRQRRA